MKKLQLASAITALVLSAGVNAATVFAPTDGNVNFFIFGLEVGTLGLFDDSDQGYQGDYINIDANGTVAFSESAITNGDYTATYSPANTLELSDSNQFILGLNVGGVWYSDDDIFDLGADSYIVNFENTDESIFSVDVQVVPSVSTVPVPAAVWLFGSGLIGLVGVSRRKTV